jgi:ABC-2 type transport system ATP-binding protein
MPRTMPAPMIDAEGLGKSFDGFHAVDDVSLQVHPGEVVALLGPNGAGKTTTVRMLAALLRPTRGRARVASYDVQESAREVRRHIGLLTEHHGLYTRMRADEYLAFFGRAYGLSSRDVHQRGRAWMRTFGLDEAGPKRLGEYSKGMRQKLALVRALLHDPPVLLLDEPTSAMDPASAHQVRRSIQLLRSEQRAVLICTHNLTEAEALADRLAIIRAGRLAAVGSVSELKQAFLGDPVMELRLVQAVDGAAGLLPDGARLAGTGADWLRYRTNDPQAVNPRVLEAMARAGLAVVTLSPVERSLEDVYLQAVGRPVEAS